VILPAGCLLIEMSKYTRGARSAIVDGAQDGARTTGQQTAERVPLRVPPRVAVLQRRAGGGRKKSFNLICVTADCHGRCGFTPPSARYFFQFFFLTPSAGRWSGGELHAAAWWKTLAGAAISRGTRCCGRHNVADAPGHLLVLELAVRGGAAEEGQQHHRRHAADQLRVCLAVVVPSMMARWSFRQSTAIK
jgi:hypothetical protein